jgi:hypothetical protein
MFARCSIVARPSVLIAACISGRLYQWSSVSKIPQLTGFRLREPQVRQHS